MSLKSVRRILWIAAGVLAAAYLGVLVSMDWRMHGHGAGEVTRSEGEAFAPTFRLTAHTGEAVTERSWPGKWLLVFFGFTNCPDICPTTLADMGVVMDALGPAGAGVQPLFISVDPERDTVAELAAYVPAFHSAILGLTGGAAEVATAVESFKAFAEREDQPEAPGGYAMAHTSSVYLINPDGRFERTYSYGTQPDEVVRDLRARVDGAT